MLEGQCNRCGRKLDNKDLVYCEICEAIIKNYPDTLSTVKTKQYTGPSAELRMALRMIRCNSLDKANEMVSLITNEHERNFLAEEIKQLKQKET
jgi:hypothetical protein